MPDAVVEKNKVVSVSYTLYDEKGDIFEYTDLPVSYLHGSGKDLFDKIETALTGKKVGDEVKITLPPADGFGNHDPGLTFTDNLDNVPLEIRRLGQEVEAQNASGEIMKFVVTDINTEANTLTVDGNHPLAGQTVLFKVVVKDIRDASRDEVQAGRPNAANTILPPNA
ncbi:MAG: FKBP-type peptidyl-prolyl cis-trans isomerase [Gammaproteobacteria bacterium]|nr:FKBP-type peptidyl-prolyl cis-trans isomerase [Gammaproteobacteria bacterium]